MLLRLLAAFCLIPLVELALLLWIASRTSWQLTLILVIATGILGAWLARQQGWRTWVRARESLERGQLPMDALGDGIMILLAGALLLTPGVLTDVVGFTLLVPPSRRAIRRWLARRLESRIHPSPHRSNRQAARPNFEGRTKIIDVKFVDPPSDSAAAGDERDP